MCPVMRGLKEGSMGLQVMRQRRSSHSLDECQGQAGAGVLLEKNLKPEFDT